MKFEPKHVSLIGVGIAAVAAIVGIIHYRSQAQQAASDASNATSGFGSFPYFQSAALPSSIGGASTGTSASTTGSGTTDVSALLASASNLQATSFVGNLANAMADALGTSGNPSGLTRGFLTPNASGGGFSFGVLSLPITSGRPLDPFIEGDPFASNSNLPYGTQGFFQTGQLDVGSNGQVTVNGSTNSTPSNSSLLH